MTLGGGHTPTLFEILFCFPHVGILLLILQVLVPPFIDGMTGNSWVKLPVLLMTSFVGCIPIGLANCNMVPVFLFWLGLAAYCLNKMDSPEFERELGYRWDRKVYYVSYCSYIALTCFLAGM